MLLDKKLGGFMPNKPKNKDEYVQQEFYCEMCGRVSEEETELNEKTNKYLCEGCRKEQSQKK
jgi:lysyl-tRNA synthetase class I|tara:strand:+ start:772 stop:957 length:186 start_codon:yes stop_codon:yes gene_type:complete